MEMSGLGLDGAPVHGLTQFAADDVDAAAGAKVHRPSFDVGTVGRIAIIEDPTDTLMGLVTPSLD